MKIGPRVWKNEDFVEVSYPMALRFEHIDDYRNQWAGVGSIMYGPLMLAAVGDGSKTDLLVGDVKNLDSWIRLNSSFGSELSFQASVLFFKSEES